MKIDDAFVRGHGRQCLRHAINDVRKNWRRKDNVQLVLDPAERGIPHLGLGSFSQNNKTNISFQFLFCLTTNRNYATSARSANPVSKFRMLDYMMSVALSSEPVMYTLVDENNNVLQDPIKQKCGSCKPTSTTAGAICYWSGIVLESK